MNRTIPFSTLSLAALLALPLLGLSVGCAANVDAEAPESDVVSEELTAAGRALVGTYSTPTPAMGGFVRLELRANGTYSAKYDMAMAMCVDCYRDESGRFSVRTVGGERRLRLAPTAGTAATYVAIKGQDLLTLTRGGRSEYLAGVSAGECNANVDCPGSQKCAPRACLMMNLCEANNPSCCGGSCQPAACWGAWLDHVGGCRAPNDGAYPASCCAALDPTMSGK